VLLPAALRASSLGGSTRQQDSLHARALCANVMARKFSRVLPTEAQMGALREQMDRDMVLRGMSPRTGESYLSAVAAMAKFYRRSPDQIDEAQVQHYLLHLITERKLAWSSCNIAVKRAEVLLPRDAQA
jgi:hypothetical protein